MHGSLVGLSLCYGLGILAGTTFNFPLTHVYSVLIIAFVTACLLIKKSIGRIPIYFCLFLIGVIVVHSNLSHPSHISNLVSAGGGRKLDLKGTIVSEPEPSSLILRAEEVLEKGKWKTVRGLVLVRLNSVDINCNYADSVRIDGYLSLPSSPRNPGEFNYRSFLARKKVYALVNVFSQNQVTLLGTGNVSPVTRLALILKHRMEIIIRKTMSPPQSLFLEAMLLGNRYLLPEDVKEIFTHTGTAHILAISGLHVGFVFSMALILFRILNFPIRMQAFLTITVIIIYCLITGGRPPAVRASIMAVMILTGMILVRPVNIWNSLALSAFLILILNPVELFGPGFQMSFMAVSGIIYINPRLQKLWNPSNSWLGRGWKAVTVITGAQVAISPLVAYYFNIFPLISFPTNLVVVPILGLVVGLGFSACISGFVWIGFAHLFNAANRVVITVLLKTLNFFICFPVLALRCHLRQFIL